jgi:predicted nuclease of predicted toxin-antitoxin system
MRFLLDMNLPPAMVDWLRSEGHDAIHIREIGLAQLPDREVFARAAEEGRIVVTFDLDFGEIVGLAGATGSGVVLLRSDWLVSIIFARGSKRRSRRRRSRCKPVQSSLSRITASASGGCRRGIEGAEMAQRI